MNTQTSDNKKKYWILLLSVLAAVCLGYMAVCDYAGLSGNIEFLQQEFFYISRYLGFIKYPYWFIHATLSGMLAVLCIYVIYRIKSSKKRYLTFVLCLFIPYFVNAIFEPGSKNLFFMTICMAVFIGGMFAMANLPGIIGRAITKHIASQNSDFQENTEVLCQKQLRKIEWIRCFPLKKVLIAGLWLFSFVIGILGIIAFGKNPQMDFLTTALLLLAIAAFTARKAWRYIITPYHCVPVLNKVLTKKQIQHLLQGEQFDLFSFENEDLQKYMPILLSENWALIEGLLVSRKFALRGDINGYTMGRKISRIGITYLNSEQFQTRTIDIYLQGERSTEVRNLLEHISGIHFPWCASNKIAQKYNAILPEIKNPQEKLYYLLSHDIFEIKHEYELMFSPKNESSLF